MEEKKIKYALLKVKKNYGLANYPTVHSESTGYTENKI